MKSYFHIPAQKEKILNYKDENAKIRKYDEENAKEYHYNFVV